MSDFFQKIGDSTETIREKIKTAKAEVLTHPERYHINKISCPCQGTKCDGYGNVIQEIDGYQYAKMCDGEIAANYDRYSGFAENVPCSFVEFERSSKFLSTKIYRAGKEFFEWIAKDLKPKGLILCGTNGTGKSFVGNIILKACEVYLKKAVYSVEYTHLVKSAKQGIEGMERLERIYKCMREADVIFLDEYGRSTSMGNPQIADEVTQTIVSICYQVKYLVVATNLKKSEINKHLNSYCIDRLRRSAGYAITIDSDEKSLR